MKTINNITLYLGIIVNIIFYRVIDKIECDLECARGVLCLCLKNALCFIKQTVNSTLFLTMSYFYFTLLS